MSTYIEIISTELINLICYNLTYNETMILREDFNFNLNYQLFLSLKFPAFYKMVKTIKNEVLRYKNYTYEEAYRVIYLIVDYSEYLIIKSVSTYSYSKYKSNIADLYNEDVEIFFDIIYEITTYMQIENIKDIITSYLMITSSNITGSKYYKYRKYFPNITDIDDIFVYTCDEIMGYINNDNNILLININSGVIPENLCMSILYILLLDDKSRIKEWKLLIHKIDNNLIEMSIINMLIFSYIIKYIELN